MEAPAVSYPSVIADTSLHLQQLVNDWRGTEQREPFIALLDACVNAVVIGETLLWSIQAICPGCRRSHGRAS